MRVPGRPTLPLTSAAPVRVGCEGRSWLFESDDPEVTSYALGVCSVCPASEWCETQARETQNVGLSLSGVWAGKVYGDPSYLPGRSSDEAVKAVHVGG